MEPVGQVAQDALEAHGPDLRATGARIEVLLEASAAGGVVARERAEELVRLVADLYGAGLERILELLHETGRLDDVVLSALADDELVASLLIVHGLHPDDVGTRVAQALDTVRPYLGSHGGDVELLGVGEDGVVRLQLLGSCDGCASSSVTLELAVKDAVMVAAPEVSSIEVVTPPAVDAGGAGFVPVSALRSRLDSPDTASGAAGAAWEPVPELADLQPGELRAARAAGVAIVACRVGPDVYAYRDRCPRCAGGLAAGSVARRAGGVLGDAVLRCPTCHAHFDVRHAGAGLDGADEHLEPLPLLVRDGVLAVALPAVPA